MINEIVLNDELVSDNDKIDWIIKLKEIGFCNSHAVDIVNGMDITYSKFESIKRFKIADEGMCWGHDILNYEKAGIL